MSLMLIFVNWFTNPDVFNLNTTDVSFWYVSLLLVWCFVEKENKSLKSVWFYCFFNQSSTYQSKTRILHSPVNPYFDGLVQTSVVHKGRRPAISPITAMWFVPSLVRDIFYKIAGLVVNYGISNTMVLEIP